MKGDSIYVKCRYLNEERVSSVFIWHDILSTLTSDYYATKTLSCHVYPDFSTNFPLNSDFFLETLFLFFDEVTPDFLITNYLCAP